MYSTGTADGDGTRTPEGGAAGGAAGGGGEGAGADGEKASGSLPPRVRPESAEALKERLQRIRDVQRKFDMQSPMEIQMRMGKEGKTRDELAPRYRDTAPATVEKKKFQEQIARLEQIPDVKILRGAGGQVRIIDVPSEAVTKAEMDHLQVIQDRVYAGFSIVMVVVIGVLIAFVYMTYLLVSHDAGPPPDEHIGAKVYLEVYQEEERVGTIVVGLYTERCPMTCENFYRLATADNPAGHTYRGCDIFQVFPHLGFVTGDHAKNNGTGARPVLPYFPGKRWFPDEMGGRDLPFFRGALCSVGPLFAQFDGHNDSLFMIAKAGTPKFNHAFVIFGEVLSGMNVIDFVSQVRVTGGSPVRRVWIKRCGAYHNTLEERKLADTPGPAQFRLDGARK